MSKFPIVDKAKLHIKKNTLLVFNSKGECISIPSKTFEVIFVSFIVLLLTMLLFMSLFFFEKKGAASVEEVLALKNVEITELKSMYEDRVAEIKQLEQMFLDLENNLEELKHLTTENNN